ncbi:MAG: TIGR03546 family protein [Gammaproteobacteria bacterium]|nr:TIGR03546 family protein [Gammaproteobacteria bacterium]
MFEPFSKLIKLLNSEQAPHQLSLAISLALVSGFTPTLGLHNLLVLFLLLVLRVNISAFILAYGSFSVIALTLDPLFHSLGMQLLQHPELTSLWTDMYNNSAWRLARFNNSIMLGSLVISLAAVIPLFFLSNFVIKQYRSQIQVRFKLYVEKFSKVMKIGGFVKRFSN